MKHFLTKYRFLTALTLILFLNTIVLPAGVSAAALFCDMEMPAVQGNSHTCCDFHNTAGQDEASLNRNDPSCTIQKICAHSLSDAQTDIQALPQLSKKVGAVAVFRHIGIRLENPGRTDPFLFESDIPTYFPPIFLLNSTFLN